MTIDRRTDILDAAFEVFARKGFNKATMDDIALEAGVSKGTIYLYFASKRKLFLAMYGHMMSSYANDASAVFNAQASPPEQLRQLLMLFARKVVENPNMGKLLPDLTVQAMQSEELYEITRSLNHQTVEGVQAMIERGITEGYFRADFDPVIAAISVQSAAAGLVGRVVMYPEWDVTASMQFFADLVLRGLSNEGTTS